MYSVEILKSQDTAVILIVLCFSSRGNLLDHSQENRNLLHSTSTKNENRFLHRGQENITNFLETLPKTKHDLGSFQIDVPIANVSE